MCKHPQKSVDEHMREHVRDYRHYDGQQQGVPAVRAWARNDPTKRFVKRTARRNYESHKAGSAARGHQCEKKSHSEQGVDYVENVIDNLRDSREPSRTLHFALCFNDLVYCLRTKLTSNLIYSVRFVWRALYCSTFADFGLYFAFDLTLYRLVLRRAPCLFDR